MAGSVAAVLFGIALLAWASDQFVIGSARLAGILRVSPLVIGVVIIGFGTSSPEALVSALAAASGEPEVALGNVVGSNLVNLSLILGVGALIYPIAVASATVRREAPIAVGAMAVFAVLAPDGIGRIEGAVLVVGLLLSIGAVLRRANRDPLGAETAEFLEPEAHRLRPEIVRAFLGLAGTLIGAQLLLTGAVDLATDAGLESGFVGATIVAVGTSLPELVTVVQSARRREPDLVLGNLLGSNVFNALGVAGLAGLIGATGVTETSITVVAPWAGVALALLTWLMMRTDSGITRREGAVLIAVYVVTVPFLS